MNLVRLNLPRREVAHVPNVREGNWQSDRGWSIVRGTNPTVYEQTGRNIRLLGFEKNAVVNACIRLISDIPGAVPWEVYSTQADGEFKVINKSAALDLLNSPRIGMSGLRLRNLTCAHFVSYGNAFWVLERPSPNAAPNAIRLVHPENIDYCYLDAETLEIVLYQWHDREGVVHKTMFTDMIHFKDLTLGDWLFGFPRAAAALLDIITDGEASNYVRQIIKNDGSPAIVFGLDAQVPKKEAEAAEERWYEKMVNRGQRGRVAFMPGATQVHQIGFNLTELEFPDLRAVTREDICAAFGVDPRMVGIASAKGAEGGLSGQQYREARFRLIQQTVTPIMMAQEAELNDWFMPEWGFDSVRYSPNGLAELTEDEQETSTRVLAEVQAGVRTREEARRAIALPEQMDPNHTLVGSIARIEYPVALQYAKAIADTTAGTDTGTQGNNDAITAESIKALPAPKSRVVRRGVTLSKEQRCDLWKRFDTRAVGWEPAYRRQALLQFSEERGGIARIFDEALQKSDDKPLGRTITDPYILAALTRIADAYNTKDGEYHQAWLRRYIGLISETFSVAGGELASTIGVDFNLYNPRVQAAIRARAKALADDVTATTAKQITAAVDAGTQAGFGAKEIAKLIDETVFAGQAPMRAERIARTETIGALNQGEYVTAQTSGVMQSSEWLTQGDDDVRTSHADQDGERVPMGTSFANGLLYPGDQSGAADEVINCRCTLLYYDEEAP